MLMLDRSRLTEVFTHLLSNSYRYTREGSITVSAEEVERGETKFVRVRIEDTGIEIPLDQQKIIFQKSAQGVLRQGAGLSLTLADR
jgi:signal transduction histidine kinase